MFRYFRNRLKERSTIISGIFGIIYCAGNVIGVDLPHLSDTVVAVLATVGVVIPDKCHLLEDY